MALFSSHVGKTCRKKTETLLNAMNPSILYGYLMFMEQTWSIIRIYRYYVKLFNLIFLINTSKRAISKMPRAALKTGFNQNRI